MWLVSVAFCHHVQVSYVSGSYDTEEGYVKLEAAITEQEDREGENAQTRRLFYLALPPSVYPVVSEMIKKYCMNKRKCTMNGLPVIKENLAENERA